VKLAECPGSKEENIGKIKSMSLKTSSRNKKIIDLYREVNGFKVGHQPGSDLIKDENGDLLVDSHSILNRWKKNFCQLLNVHGIIDVRQTEKHR
jgi:hypothetical protein